MGALRSGCRARAGRLPSAPSCPGSATRTCTGPGAPRCGTAASRGALLAALSPATQHGCRASTPAHLTYMVTRSSPATRHQGSVPHRRCTDPERDGHQRRGLAHRCGTGQAPWGPDVPPALRSHHIVHRPALRPCKPPPVSKTRASQHPWLQRPGLMEQVRRTRLA